MSTIARTPEPRKPAGGFLFHVVNGKSEFMYNADMRHALTFPEWKDRPWTAEEVATYERKYKIGKAA